MAADEPQGRDPKAMSPDERVAFYRSERERIAGWMRDAGMVPSEEVKTPADFIRWARAMVAVAEALCEQTTEDYLRKFGELPYPLVVPQGDMTAGCYLARETALRAGITDLPQVPPGKHEWPTFRALLLSFAAIAEAQLQSPNGNPTSESGPTIADDGVWLRAGGKVYHFTKGNQSNAILCLFKAWQKAGREDGCGLGEETIADQVGSAASDFRMSKVFTGHPAWQTVIRSPSKGTYALYLLPPSPPAAGPEKGHVTGT